jgi:hypothetical protein
VLPRAVLQNVAVCAGLPGHGFFTNRVGSSLICHDSFPAWRHPRAYFSQFDDVTLLLGRHRARDRGAILKLFGAAMGSPPNLAWTSKQSGPQALKHYAYA